MEARVYNSYFLYTDQYLTIFDQTIQCILVTGLVVVLVSLLLLPDSLAAACAVLSIMSTLLGTLGFMSLWGIVLDGITLINLIMCIGFSVDFTAHFCYYYIDCKSHQQGSKGENLVENTLLAVKKPILQVHILIKSEQAFLTCPIPISMKPLNARVSAFQKVFI
jgi:predicted RND superfamily exporter protein